MSKACKHNCDGKLKLIKILLTFAQYIVANLNSFWILTLNYKYPLEFFWLHSMTPPYFGKITPLLSLNIVVWFEFTHQGLCMHAFFTYYNTEPIKYDELSKLYENLKVGQKSRLGFDFRYFLKKLIDFNLNQIITFNIKSKKLHIYATLLKLSVISLKRRGGISKGNEHKRGESPRVRPNGASLRLNPLLNYTKKQYTKLFD
ncbi:hypothetical protein BpHYR1_003894 [Brachionus plicatilis]|uniref:Uncharacterized protein n=1 Tax=Brachionus plicatilis TaxID=10195 RepID=A0A3M7PIP6_BRAPC|nr:hypothetical protein BpHYR1_003894 [Brachionus plicatilis]